MGSEQIDRGLPRPAGRAAAYAITTAAALAGLGISTAQARDKADPPEVKRPPGMKTYQTRYYVLHTDISAEMVLEAKRRLALMAEEYWARTRSFGGIIRDRMDFYIFKNRADYAAAGTPPGSVGVFTCWSAAGKRCGRLMAALSSARNWRIVQHEGFHQFVYMTMSNEIPVWANEGLAEYFGEGIWTGDAFVLGILPPQRCRQVVGLIESDRLMSLLDMMKLSNQEWNLGLSERNYDQAWSMVHFLAHGNGGKYQAAFASFLREVANGQPWEKAWMTRFGRDTDKFRNLYTAWWKAAGVNPPTETYNRALVQTLTSFLARAAATKQTFTTAEEFFAAAGGGKLKLDPVKQANLWLPESLLADALQQTAQAGAWTLETKSTPRLTLTDAHGGQYVGGYSMANGRITTQVTYTPPPKPPATASAPAPVENASLPR